MEIEVLESKKNYLEFYIIGETHTFCNALRRVLAEDKAVKRVSYTVEHPITHRTKPRFEVEADAKSRPSTVLRRGAKKLARMCDEIGDGFKEALG